MPINFSDIGNASHTRTHDFKNNVWGKLNQSAPFSWMQNTYDTGTRGSNRYQIGDDTAGWATGDVNEKRWQQFTDDPNAFYRWGMSQAGLNDNTPFGSFLSERMTPQMMSVLNDMYTTDNTSGQGEFQSAQEALGTTEAATRWLMGEDSPFGADYRTVGESLSSILGGNDSMASEQVMQLADSPREQYEYIGQMIAAAGVKSIGGTRERLMIGRYEQIKKNYDMEGIDVPFHEYLTEHVADDFLNYYWPSQSWGAGEWDVENVQASDAEDAAPMSSQGKGQAEYFGIADGGGTLGFEQQSQPDFAGHLRAYPRNVARFNPVWQGARASDRVGNRVRDFLPF